MWYRYLGDTCYLHWYQINRKLNLTKWTQVNPQYSLQISSRHPQIPENWLVIGTFIVPVSLDGPLWGKVLIIMSPDFFWNPFYLHVIYECNTDFKNSMYTVITTDDFVFMSVHTLCPVPLEITTHLPVPINPRSITQCCFLFLHLYGCPNKTYTGIDRYVLSL